MERVIAQLDGGIETLRTEWRAVAGGSRGGRESLVRMLSLRHALAAGTRRRYLALATQLDLAGRGAVRNLVYRWAMDDELHERLAESELWQLDKDPVEAPLDAKLWEAYFDAIVVTRPCATLGAAAAWEGLSSAAAALGRERRLAGTSASAGRTTNRFSQQMENDEPSRADELIAAMRGEDWDDEEMSELMEGAASGRLMGLRMVQWALGHEELCGGAWPRFSRWGSRLG